jgi:hypothetical protein
MVAGELAEFGQKRPVAILLVRTFKRLLIPETCRMF